MCVNVNFQFHPRDMSEKVLNGHPCACDEVSAVSDGSIMLATVWFRPVLTVKLRFRPYARLNVY